MNVRLYVLVSSSMLILSSQLAHEICLLYILDSIAKAKMGREIAIPVVSELLTATAE
jgi:hypothetical protein